MTSITEAIRQNRQLNQDKPIQVDELGDEESSLNSSIEANQSIQHHHEADLTHEEWDNGIKIRDHKGSAELTGKLCRRVMALIWWKVGTNKAVTDCMVQALEEWLHRRGISIYMDLL
jgi:hypothetical protein